MPLLWSLAPPLRDTGVQRSWAPWLCGSAAPSPYRPAARGPCRCWARRLAAQEHANTGPGGRSEQGQLALARRAPQLGCLDRHVVDAGLTAGHVASVVELPQLVAVRAPPLSLDVTGLVLEAHGDAIALEGPQVLAQAVVALPFPPAGQRSEEHTSE